MAGLYLGGSPLGGVNEAVFGILSHSLEGAEDLIGIFHLVEGVGLLIALFKSSKNVIDGIALHRFATGCSNEVTQATR